MMANGDSLYAWAMERQFEMQREALIRRQIRDARKDRGARLAGVVAPIVRLPRRPAIERLTSTEGVSRDRTA